MAAIKPWKYRVIFIKPEGEGEGARVEVETALDAQGQEGWEMVCVSGNFAIFKRPA